MIVGAALWLSVALVMAYGIAYFVLTALQLVLLPRMFPEPEPGPILAAWLAFRLPHGEYAGAVTGAVFVAAWLKEVYQRGAQAVEGDPQAGRPPGPEV